MLIDRELLRAGGREDDGVFERGSWWSELAPGGIYEQVGGGSVVVEEVWSATTIIVPLYLNLVAARNKAPII